MRTGAGISLPFGIHIDRVVVDAETCKSGGGNLTPAWSGRVDLSGHGQVAQRACKTAKNSAGVTILAPA